MPKLKTKFSIVLLCLLLGASLGFSQPRLEVSFLSVGQAEATLLQGLGFTILIDAGDYSRSDVVPYLKMLGVEKIDLMILTHPHADHIGQAAAVLNTFPVKEVWMSGFPHTTKVFEGVLDCLIQSEAAYHEPRRGEKVSFENLSLEVLNPTEPLKNYMHETCIVVRAVYGDVAFLFTGDIERKTEREIIKSKLPISAQILQIAHHGSRTSSDIEFVLGVDPEIAIYSAGVANPFGHPHPEVVQRFSSLDIPIFGTDVHGTITVKTDGKTYELTTKKTAAKETISYGVDLNSAGLEELQRIIHIGPVRAAEIIKLRAQRPFRNVDDLTRVSGLGQKRIEDIKKQGLAYVGE